MAKAGIVGGLGPASTIDYYRGLVDDYRKTHGDDQYPDLVIDSLNMGGVVACIERHDYPGLADRIVASLDNLKRAGADFAAIASNSPHIAWDLISKRAPLPVLSIIDAVCAHILVRDYRNVLIFATKFTMKNGLYARALEQRQIGWTLPEADDIERLGAIIYPNLENGIVLPEEKRRMQAIAESTIARCRCDALLLGCTEIPLMIRPGDVSVPVIDSTAIHIQAIAARLAGGSPDETLY